MLASGNIKNNKAFSYKYDPNNLRYSKTVNGVETLYYWDDDVLLGERTGDNFIQYIYDADGIAGMRYNGAHYYFEKNLFGDVLRVYSFYGSVAEFKQITIAGNMLDYIVCTCLSVNYCISLTHFDEIFKYSGLCPRKHIAYFGVT